MSLRDPDKPLEFGELFQTIDEIALLSDYYTRRFKSDAGIPILNATQLHDLSLRREEEALVHQIYDRFSSALPDKKKKKTS